METAPRLLEFERTCGEKVRLVSVRWRFSGWFAVTAIANIRSAFVRPERRPDRAEERHHSRHSTFARNGNVADGSVPRSISTVPITVAIES